jgi:hypothetical protein
VSPTGGARLATLPQAAIAPAAPVIHAVPRRPATAVQLRAAMPIQVVTDHYGNFVERRVVRTDVLRERGDNIAELLGYWHALKGDDRVSSFADIDPVRLAQLGLLGRLHVLNCENPDPLLMRFDLYGNEVPLDKGRIYTGLGRRPPGPHPRADRRRRLRHGAPHYFRIRKQLDGVGYRYARLSLPFSTGEGRVDRSWWRSARSRTMVSRRTASRSAQLILTMYIRSCLASSAGCRISGPSQPDRIRALILSV